MSHGEILQYSTPVSCMRSPALDSLRVPWEANVIEVQSYDGGFASTALGRLAVSNVDGGLGVGSKSLLLRPENIRISRDATGFTGDISVIRAEVVRSLFLGSRCLVTVRCDSGQELKIECASSSLPKSGAGIWIAWDKASAVLLAN
ncbi:TOBE domain-containing protein (plasmid) [Sinorhizobium meliloti]|nr:TOBE domain-containing protein [Sinorhizobium meliloti]